MKVNKMKAFYRNKLRKCFPVYLEQLVGWKEIGFAEIILYLEDGSVFIFDAIDDRLRPIQNKFEDMDDDLFRKEFGSRLNRLMKFRGADRYEISELTGISISTISRYCNGYANPSLRTAYKLCKALDCSIEDLFYEY